MIICANGHSFCSNCAGKLEVCAHCRLPCLAEKIVNIALLKIVELQARKHMISVKFMYIKLVSDLFSRGKRTQTKLWTRRFWTFRQESMA